MKIQFVKIFLVSIIFGVLTAAAQSQPVKLAPHKSFDSQIKGGETQEFAFKLKKGEFARIEVEQQNINVMVSLIASDEKKLIEVNGNFDFLWRESISAIAETSGIYKLQITSLDPKERSGTILVKIVEQRSSANTDIKRIEAEQNLTRGIKFLIDNKPKESVLAFESSLKLWAELGDRYWEAATKRNLAVSYFVLKRNDEALQAFKLALPVFQEFNDRRGISKTFNGLGAVLADQKEFENAKGYLEQALRLRRELRDMSGEYITLSNLYPVYYNLNQQDKVADSQNRMLEIRDEQKAQSSKAESLKDFGDFYKEVHNYEKAAEYYEMSLPLFQDAKDVKSEIYLRMFLGLIYGSTYEYEKGKIHLEKYAELVKATGESGNWTAYQYLGMIYQALNQPDKILPNYEKALEIAKKIDDNRASEGEILFSLGSYFETKGVNDKAKIDLEEALKIARQNDSQNGEQAALRALASVYLNLKEFDKAESYGEQSLAINRKASKFNEAQALNSNGLIYLNTGKYEKALENFEAALKVSREIKNNLLEADNLYILGLTYSSLGKYDQAITYYENSLKIAREKNYRRMIISALSGLGSANKSLSRFQAAAKHFDEALKIANDLQLQQEIASVSSRLGNIYVNLSQYDKAERYLETSLKIAVGTGDKLQESLSLTYLGQIFSKLNQYDKAREKYEKVLKIGQETNNIYAQYDALTNLGFIYINFNQYDKAKEYLGKAGILSKELKTANGNIDILYGLGTIYTDLNSPEKAANLVQQSLELVQNVKNRRGEGVILNKLGEVYLLSKQFDKAQEQYEKALSIAREVKSPVDEADALISLGWVYTSINRLAEAREFYEKGLTLARQVKSRTSEGSALNGLGIVDFKNKKYQEAEDFYHQSLGIAKEVQSKKLGADVLQNLMDLFKELGQPQLAIVYGKQSVNAFQEIRGNIKDFEKESRQSFLKDKEIVYRTLADLLISEGRVSEARLILELLKTEEYFQLARSDEKKELVPYSRAEAAVTSNVENLISLEKERDDLLKLETPTDEQNKRLEELQNEINSANKSLDSALKELATAESSIGSRVNDFEDDINKNSLQSALTTLRQDTNSGVVALYTVLGKEEEKDKKTEINNAKTKFGWVIMVTEKSYKAYPIDVTNFNQIIFQFQSALGSDKYDPRPLAEKIYNAIFRQKSAGQKRTLEQDLQAYLGSYKDKTIMWSLDGVLRYIPMAALHDGKNYLVEKYRSVIFTNNNFVSLEKENKADWKILGLGVSEQRENFNALPGVKTELETIVREPNSQTGIISGTIKLNENFKKQMLFREISRGIYPVVHIASHYSFNPTQQNESFLLLGDGHLTFGEMEENKNLFGAVDLLTLSACDTATSGNGKEEEGFAVKAQQLGAKSVIASLWQVSDAGTPELMIRFYKLRSEHSDMSKGEAFREAQLSLLAGDKKENKTGNDKTSRAEIVGNKSGEFNLPLFIKGAQIPFAHPHYWASFVLIGNWR